MDLRGRIRIMKFPIKLKLEFFNVNSDSSSADWSIFESNEDSSPLIEETINIEETPKFESPELEVSTETTRKKSRYW